ncbi:DinB family protein [Lysinibacillus cavernae]|uniref:DinB family protein n=1 Tax=Lysinibacillus cavernae TaxID=2666135 RepID=UPI0012D913BE|nr:DinB family protein [Lysinibacillus cavernae]
MQQDKTYVIKHYEKSIDWISELRSISEDQWRMPIEPGKWTVAEVIGHLPPWDEFVLHHRIPFLFTGECLPKGPDVTHLNTLAAKKSSEQSMDETITDFISTRSQLLQAIQPFTDDQWQQSFKIGQSELTIVDYFVGLINHDSHHFSQIQHVIHV